MHAVVESEKQSRFRRLLLIGLRDRGFLSEREKFFPFMHERLKSCILGFLLHHLFFERKFSETQNEKSFIFVEQVCNGEVRSREQLRVAYEAEFGKAERFVSREFFHVM